MPETAVSPSDVARAYARLAPALPDAAAHDLLTLLSATIADPGEHTDRESRLGLLVRIVENDPELPDTSAYDEARREHEGDWPSASQLSRYYGGWLGALDAAATLAAPQAGRRAPADRAHTHLANTRAYSRAQLASALIRCHNTLGFWPGTQDYSQYRRVHLRTARLHISGIERQPNARTIRRHFGSWDAAIECAAERALPAAPAALRARHPQGNVRAVQSADERERVST